MIQVSYMIDGPVPALAAPFRTEARPDGGTRVTGVWPHRDLWAARRQVAAALSTLPAETIVRCNFTGRSRTLSQWLPELAAKPTVSASFEARHANVEGRLVARIFGLYQLGESDVVLVADAGADVSEVYAFLSAWAGFRLAANDEPSWDRPFPWGWWLVSFAEHDVGDDEFWALMREALASQHLREAFDDRMQAPPPRLVIEARDPSDADTTYLIGATSALATFARQRRTAARLGAAPPASPSAQDAAGFCERALLAFDQGAPRPFFAYREPSKGPLDSGWRLACLDAGHVHDDASLRIAPIGRARCAGLVDYLGLPPGWVVTWEEDAFWTTAPGDDRSHRDDEHEPEPEPAGLP